MSKTYTFDDWWDTFDPKPNKLIGDNHTYTFETYGAEYAEVVNADPNTVWTEVDGDEGTYIVAGLHFVNRIHYYITRKKWKDPYDSVVTWLYKPCPNSEEGECSNDCPECRGESSLDVPCDTYADLESFYGGK